MENVTLPGTGRLLREPLQEVGTFSLQTSCRDLLKLNQPLHSEPIFLPCNGEEKLI